MRIGIDLGGTKIEGILLGPDNRIQKRLRRPTPRDDYPATLAAIASLVQSLETDLTSPASIGIGIPGTLDRHSGLVKNANSTWLIGHPLDHDLATVLKRPVRVANDADCFTLSEHMDGAAQDRGLTFGVILGTGVGGGIAVHSQLLSGPNGICGEWGHNPLPWTTDEEPASACYCGQNNCIETFLSGPGMAARFTRRHGLPAENAPTAQQIFAHAEAGHSAAQKAVDQYCEHLARGLASVINLLDPDVIVLGGGLSNASCLYREVPARWGRYVFSSRVDTDLVQAVHGDSSGVRGAAWLWPETKTALDG